MKYICERCIQRRCGQALNIKCKYIYYDIDVKYICDRKMYSDKVWSGVEGDRKITGVSNGA